MAVTERKASLCAGAWRRMSSLLKLGLVGESNLCLGCETSSIENVVSVDASTRIRNDWLACFKVNPSNSIVTAACVSLGTSWWDPLIAFIFVSSIFLSKNDFKQEDWRQIDLDFYLPWFHWTGLWRMRLRTRYRCSRILRLSRAETRMRERS